MRVKRGKEVPRTPSRFLEDLPPDAFEVVDMDAPRHGPPDEKENPLDRIATTTSQEMT